MAILEHVKAGEIPSARKENQRIDAINALSDRLNTLYTGAPSAGGLRVTISNTGQTPVLTGQPMAVTGCRVSGTYGKMVSLYKSGSIPLAGGAISATSELIAYALEGIPAGGIGKAFCPGLFAARVEIAVMNHQFAKPAAGRLVSTTNGRYKILAKSAPDEDDVAFCLLWMMTGHRVGTTASGSGTGTSWSANVTIAGATVPVKCPLLRSNETIDNGTIVILSLNEAGGEWQVIEAQCPAESGGSGSGSGR